MTLGEARKEIRYFENGATDSFMTKLIEAMQRADRNNLGKLFSVYPELTYAFAEKYRPEIVMSLCGNLTFY